MVEPASSFQRTRPCLSGWHGSFGRLGCSQPYHRQSSSYSKSRGKLELEWEFKKNTSKKSNTLTSICISLAPSTLSFSFLLGFFGLGVGVTAVASSRGVSASAEVSPPASELVLGQKWKHRKKSNAYNFWNGLGCLKFRDYLIVRRGLSFLSFLELGILRLINRHLWNGNFGSICGKVCSF